MSDLIDLKSPETKAVRGSKLASPLIPVPTDAENGNPNTCSVGISSLSNENRNSLDNNPFDMVYKKTTEYVRKKDDPFELVLEKALRSKPNKSNASRAFSISSPRDFTPKRKKRADALKLNKTLDDSLFGSEPTVLNCKKDTSFKGLNDSIIHDLNNTNLLCDDTKQSHVNTVFLECHDASPLNSSANLSILNNTAMNDTLSEVSCTSEGIRMKSVTQDDTSVKTRKELLDPEKLDCGNNYLNLPKLRRSLSQGAKFSPKKYLSWRSQSITESVKPPEQCTSDRTIDSLPSVFFDDSLNKAFVESQQTNSSIFSNMSDISAIRKLSTVSTTGYNSSTSYLSDGTMNRGFVNSNSSAKSSVIQRRELANPTAIPRSLSVSSMPPTAIELSDLTNRFNKLKTKSLECSVQENDSSDKTSNENSVQEINVIQKLIDIDVFVPEKGNDNDLSKDSTSDSSVNSVFSENSKKDKSILHEAMVLAKTFEELAIKSDGNSNSEVSTEDLLSDNHPWISDLLPAFEDEDRVDNLIELPMSPNASTKTGTSSKEDKESTPPNLNDAKSEQNLIRDIEIELLSPISAEKKTAAATLLLDLEKIVETENNSEAIKLLDQLEKVLGIDCKSNAKLLATCLHTETKVEKDSQKSKRESDQSDSTEAVKPEQSAENNEIPTPMENSEKLGDSNPVLNSQITNKLVDDSQKSVQKDVKISEKESPRKTSLYNVIEKNGKERNIANLSNHKTDPDIKKVIKSENKNSANKEMTEQESDEKLAVELLVNLAKVLSKQSAEPTTLDVLQNLGKVLNFAMNSSNFNNSQTKDVPYKFVRQSSLKGKSNLDKRASFSGLSKSGNRQSLDMSKTRSTERSFRRRSSISHTTPTKPVPGSPIPSKTKSRPHLKEIKKRFSSDPGLISTIQNSRKINSTPQSKTRLDSEKDTALNSVPLTDMHKEKPLAILHTAKNKFKKKVESDGVTKKGPMKAFLPVGSMQKLEAAERKVSSSTDAVTPPKSSHTIPRFTVTSSTPNLVHNNSTYKRSPRSKPIASSTPDSGTAKLHSTKIKPSQETNKCEIACEISPVSTQADDSVNNKSNGSPRIGKSPILRKQTPIKTQRGDTGPFNRPKYFTSPRIIKKNNSQVELNQGKQYSEPTQIPSWKTHELKNGSPLKKGRSLPQQSPLKDCNNLPAKARPFKLISKLQYSGGNNMIEKENNYA